MASRGPHLHGGRAQQERKTFSPLVDCAVRVSPTLARLIRKCADAETGGASPRDALLMSAGISVGEIEALRADKARLAAELAESADAVARLRSSQEAGKSEAVRLEADCRQLRRLLNAQEEKSRESARAADARVKQLEAANAQMAESLKQSVSLQGMNERAAAALVALKTGLDRGEDIETAALAAAGYERAPVEAALEKSGRPETRILDAALERRTWRARLALRLLGLAPREPR